MKNILQFGTCRTHQLTSFNNEEITFTNLLPRVHTTKEAIQYLEKRHKYKGPIDFIMIEISTLKLFEKDGKYFYGGSEEAKDINPTIQTEEIFKQDIEEFYKALDIPLLFVGHLDLDFYDIHDGHISRQRKIIDNYIQKYCHNYLIFRDLYKDYDYHQLVKAPKDTHHLNHFAYELLYDAVVNKINSMEPIKYNPVRNIITSALSSCEQVIDWNKQPDGSIIANLPSANYKITIEEQLS